MPDAAAPTTDRLALRAEALARMAQGMSNARIAAELGVPEGTVKSWRARDGARFRAAPAVAGEIIPADPPPARIRASADAPPDATGKRLAELVATYLEASLETLIAQHGVLRDPEWIREQSAGDLAVLRGVEADKVMRMLQLIEGRSG